MSNRDRMAIRAGMAEGSLNYLLEAIESWMRIAGDNPGHALEQIGKCAEIAKEIYEAGLKETE